MRVDCMIVGQGICGTFLSWYLEKAGLSFITIDESIAATASKAAAGIINPVTGRRMVKTWMIDELLPFALEAYSQIGHELGISCISQQYIIDFFPSPQMRLAFLERYKEDSQYLQKPADENVWRNHFNYDFGFGEIQPGYLVDLNKLIAAFRIKLINRDQLRQEQFIADDIVVSDQAIRYRDLEAGRIIFCDGIGSCSNPYFQNLPFAPNKGEVLIAEISDLPPGHIYKKAMSIASWKENLYWVGSSYEWKFDDDRPSESFRQRTEYGLKEWLKVPFKIVDHLASIRPATLERRPFVGFHPLTKNIGILNGMGTKGCSLAPFFASQLAQHIKHQSAIIPEAAIQRFSNILGRSFFSN
jgi:glycine/D-amino acid oxidase-like deaminating enzyme